MSLTDFAVRTTKATGKVYTLRDSLDRFLHVTAKGGRAWHFRYFRSYNSIYSPMERQAWRTDS